MITPLVSICIPTYNGAQYLEACLDSVLSQSYPDFEVVIVDDQSSDQTWNILDQYVVRDSRIRLFRNEQNLGLVGNWNRCLELAQGEWIKFVFQDDWITPDCIEHMVKASVGSQSLLTVCQREFVFESVSDSVINAYQKLSKNFSLAVIFKGKHLIPAEEFCDTVLEHQELNFLGEPTSMLIHRDAITRYGKFNPYLIQLCDYEYWVRIGVNTGILYVPETLAYFRIHGNNTSFSNEQNRAFAKNIIDPLKLRYEYAYGSHYLPLRQAALAKGKNIRHTFRTQLLDEQIKTYYATHTPNSTTPPLFEEWRKIQPPYTCMKLTRLLPDFIIVWLKRLERKCLYLLFQDSFYP